MYRRIIILLTAILLLGCSNSQNGTGKTNLTAKEFFNFINEQKHPQLIDVRTPEEFEGGHLENAMNIDWNSDDFMEQVASLDKSKPVMVYCLSGGRSSAAADAIRKNGFEQVYELSGGMMQWRSAKLPETTGNTADQSISMKEYKQLLESDKLVLVDFYAEWCGPCKKMKPYLAKIAEDSRENVVIIRIDVDKNPELVNQLKIVSIPVLKLYKDEQLVWENVGFIEEAKVREKLKTNL